MNFKYIITRVIYKLRYKLHNKLPLQKIMHQGQPKVYLFGTIEHMNYGDQAINLAEDKLMQDQNIDYISIPESYIDEALPVIKQYIQADDIIYCHGGGNMGDVWPEQEKWRHNIFNLFPDNKIMVFPQSVNYKLDSNLLKEAIQTASKHQQLTFLMRDEFSYRFVKENFPNNVNVELVPDIVMTLDKANNKVQRVNKVTTFLRRDVEKLADNRIDNLLQRVSQEYQLDYSDTVSDYWYYVDERNREAFLDKKLRDFQSSKFIITDRLHGMIFAAITKTPALVFDNNNHKIYNLYNTWLKDIKFIKFIDKSMDMAAIEMALDELLANDNYDFPNQEFKEKIEMVLKK